MTVNEFLLDREMQAQYTVNWESILVVREPDNTEHEAGHGLIAVATQLFAFYALGRF